MSAANYPLKFTYSPNHEIVGVSNLIGTCDLSATDATALAAIHTQIELRKLNDKLEAIIDILSNRQV